MNPIRNVEHEWPKAGTLTWALCRRRILMKLMDIRVEICRVNVSRLTVTKVDCISK